MFGPGSQLSPGRAGAPQGEPARIARLAAATAAIALWLATGAGASEPQHGISVFGDLKYPPGFPHFDYVRPDAPKGGALELPGLRTFDSLNPFIRKGRPVTLVVEVYDSLLERADDEPSARYGLLAETVELADDESWIEFRLRPEARWHDGLPVTADDVVFTVDVLKEKGSPLWKTRLRAVTHAEKRGPRTVRIHMGGARTRQLPLQIGDLEILPKHWWATREFEETSLEPPLGSGPYRVSEVEAGRRVVFERVPDYWARDLAVNVGRYNFDRIQSRYFLDLAVQLEAIKAGLIHFTIEGVSKTWATGYDTPARDRGHLVQEMVTSERPALNRPLTFNLRRKKFRDPRVREALAHIYDHGFTSAVLTYHEYTLARSYFQYSDMEHRGPPPAAELELLEPFREELDPRLFERQFDPPQGSEQGRDRESLRIANRLLGEAGWVVREGVRVHRETGEAFEIELLLSVPAWSRMALGFADSLRHMGVRTTIKTPYTAEYRKRLFEHDFDMIYDLYRHDLVPGGDLRNRYHSAAADQSYSQNYAGIKSRAVDALIERVIAAQSREELVIAARALDRVLCWGFYGIDQGHTPGLRFAYWNRFARPETPPRFQSGFPHTWWVDPVRDAMITEGTPIPLHQAGVP